MIERRALLRGLFAAPAIVAVGSLMPLRGVLLEPKANWVSLPITPRLFVIEPPPLLRIVIDNERYRAELNRMIEHIAFDAQIPVSRLRV